MVFFLPVFFVETSKAISDCSSFIYDLYVSLRSLSLSDFKISLSSVSKFHDDVSQWVSFHPFFPWAFERPFQPRNSSPSVLVSVSLLFY